MLQERDRRHNMELNAMKRFLSSLEGGQELVTFYERHWKPKFATGPDRADEVESNDNGVSGNG